MSKKTYIGLMILITSFCSLSASQKPQSKEKRIVSKIVTNQTGNFVKPYDKNHGTGNTKVNQSCFLVPAMTTTFSSGFPVTMEESIIFQNRIT
jgi:hypothetical protein